MKEGNMLTYFEKCDALDRQERMVELAEKRVRISGSRNWLLRELLEELKKNNELMKQIMGKDK